MIPASLAFYQGGYSRRGFLSAEASEDVEIVLMNSEPIRLPKEDITYFTQETDVYQVSTETTYMLPLWLTVGLPSALVSIFSGIPTVPISLLERGKEGFQQLFPETFGDRPM